MTTPHAWLFNRNPRTNYADAIAVVAQEFGLPASELKSGGKSPHISRPRMLAMYLMHEQGWSLPQIGKRFGLHHTSVLHGVRQIKQMIAMDGRAALEVERMKARVGEVIA